MENIFNKIGEFPYLFAKSSFIALSMTAPGLRVKVHQIKKF